MNAFTRTKECSNNELIRALVEGTGYFVVPDTSKSAEQNEFLCTGRSIHAKKGKNKKSTYFLPHLKFPSIPCIMHGPYKLNFNRMHHQKADELLRLHIDVLCQRWIRVKTTDAMPNPTSYSLVMSCQHTPKARF
jgi:hypothetical protein